MLHPPRKIKPCPNWSCLLDVSRQSLVLSNITSEGGSSTGGSPFDPHGVLRIRLPSDAEGAMLAPPLHRLPRALDFPFSWTPRTVRADPSVGSPRGRPCSSIAPPSCPGRSMGTHGHPYHHLPPMQILSPHAVLPLAIALFAFPFAFPLGRAAAIGRSPL